MTVATSNPPSTEPRPQHCPAPPSSTTSLSSSEGKFSIPPAATHQNGAPTMNGEARPAISSKKPTFTSRLSRMFSQRDTNESSREALKDKVPEKGAEKVTDMAAEESELP
ncbi:hypothetical protein LTR28_009450, partial [Elasticomyces elasticus]